jgi:hypothetical protein
MVNDSFHSDGGSLHAAHERQQIDAVLRLRNAVNSGKDQLQMAKRRRVEVVAVQKLKVQVADNRPLASGLIFRLEPQLIQFSEANAKICVAWSVAATMHVVLCHEKLLREHQHAVSVIAAVPTSFAARMLWKVLRNIDKDSLTLQSTNMRQPVLVFGLLVSKHREALIGTDVRAPKTVAQEVNEGRGQRRNETVEVDGGGGRSGGLEGDHGQADYKRLVCLSRTSRRQFIVPP